MTHTERMLAAMRLQPVDGMPYATYNLNPYAGSRHTSEASYAELLERVRMSAGVTINISCGGLGVAMSRVREGVSEVRLEGSGDARIRRTTIHTPKGDLVSIARAPENKPGMMIQSLVSNDSELERYLSLPYEPPEFDLTRAREFITSAGDHAVLFLCYPDPMYATVELFGFEEFSIRCLTDIRTIKRTVDWFFERCVENMKRLTSACRGTKFVLHTSGPEICTPPMLAPRFFAELVTPCLRKLIEIIHDADLLAAIHCHGRVREVFPEIIKTGVDLLEPIEPPDQGNITLAELMEQAHGRICLMGYIQDQEFYTASPGTMTRRVKHIAKVVKGRTGYIMSPTCTPFEFPCSDIYRRNYTEWLDAAQTFSGPGAVEVG